MESYKIIKCLGKGSSGSAYLVQDIKKHLFYVIKNICMVNMDKKARDETLKEVEVLRQLKHEHIIKYLNSFIENDNLYILTEYCEAGDLHTIIKNRKGRFFLENQILNWFVQICLAVKYVHERNILHRDIKSKNIFITKAGTIKLGDFGVARILNSSTEFARTCVGTPYYLSPEIWENKPYNNKSDIWSLGCVLYELVTLRQAFEAANLEGLILKVTTGFCPSISQSYDQEIQTLLSLMLRKNPGERPAINEILKKKFLLKYVSGDKSEVKGECSLSEVYQPSMPNTTNTCSAKNKKVKQSSPAAKYGVSIAAKKIQVKPKVSTKTTMMIRQYKFNMSGKNFAFKNGSNKSTESSIKSQNNEIGNIPKDTNKENNVIFPAFIHDSSHKTYMKLDTNNESDKLFCPELVDDFDSNSNISDVSHQFGSIQSFPFITSDNQVALQSSVGDPILAKFINMSLKETKKPASGEEKVTPKKERSVSAPYTGRKKSRVRSMFRETDTSSWYGDSVNSKNKSNIGNIIQNAANGKTICNRDNMNESDNIDTLPTLINNTYLLNKTYSICEKENQDFSLPSLKNRGSDETRTDSKTYTVVPVKNAESSGQICDCHRQLITTNVGIQCNIISNNSYIASINPHTGYSVTLSKKLSKSLPDPKQCITMENLDYMAPVCHVMNRNESRLSKIDIKAASKSGINGNMEKAACQEIVSLKPESVLPISSCLIRDRVTRTPIFHEIEEIRVHLETKLGLDTFLNAYKEVEYIFNNVTKVDALKGLKKVKALLGPGKEKCVEDILELIGKERAFLHIPKTL